MKSRTLTKLYNDQPAWLVDAHAELDAAVAAAYELKIPMTDDEILAELLNKNLK